MPTWVYLLDLVDDETAIATYESYHRNVWPEVLDHLSASGLASCQIYRAGNRLVMLTESEHPVPSDGGTGAVPDRVKEWETLMDDFQQRLPFAQPGVKWMLASQIFSWAPTS